MSRLTKERTKVSVERTHYERGEKKDSNFSLFNSLSLSLSRKTKKRRARTEMASSPSRARASLSFVFDIERERTLRRDERKKTNKISPRRNKGKEEISLGHPKKKKKKKKKKKRTRE